MKYYLIEITNYVDGKAESKGIYAYDTKDEAVANFLTKSGGAMKNANYLSELCIVVDSTGATIERRYWQREILPQPQPEPVETPSEE